MTNLSPTYAGSPSLLGVFGVLRVGVFWRTDSFNVLPGLLPLGPPDRR